MSPPKGPSLDVLVESLLQEASKAFQESKGLEWEWEHFQKLHNLISQIQLKEAGRDAAEDAKADEPNSEVQRRKSKIVPFLKWLKEHNVEIKNLKIKDVGSNGLGVITTVNLKADEPVITIPEQIMITTNNARDSKLKILADKDPIIRTMPNVLLSLFLLLEKYVTGDASFWKSYIDILPSTYDTVQYFSVDDMELLKYSVNGFRDALRMYRNILRQYAYFHNVFRKSTDSASRALRTVFTFKKYAWATATAMTRQNSLTRPGEVRDDMCLIPLWDMCNHEETGKFSNSYDPEKKVLICYAGHDFPAGSEFKFFYGQRSSLDHFTHGGFVPEYHNNDLYNLELGIGINDLNFMRKKAVLGKYELKTQEVFPMKPSRMNDHKGVVIFLKIFLGGSDLLDQIESKEDWSFMDTPDDKVWQFLVTRFNILAKAAETVKGKLLSKLSVEYPDEKSVPYRAKMVVQLLKNEQKLLELLSESAKTLADDAIKKNK